MAISLPVLKDAKSPRRQLEDSIQAGPHDVIDFNSIHYVRVLADGKAVQYYGKDGEEYIHFSITAKTSDRSAADLLQTVVSSLHREMSDDAAMDQRRSLLGSPNALGGEEMLKQFYQVLRRYTETHDGLYPICIYDVFATGFCNRSQFADEPGHALVMSPGIPQTPDLPADIMLANVDDLKTGDALTLFADGSIRMVPPKEWADVITKSNASRYAAALKTLRR